MASFQTDRPLCISPHSGTDEPADHVTDPIATHPGQDRTAATRGLKRRSSSSSESQAMAKAVKRAHFDDTCCRVDPANCLPSPPSSLSPELRASQEICDSIVANVVEELSRERGCPRSTKDLAAALIISDSHVARSANPTSLISSRLAAFLKLHWTAINPCPITKQVVSTHPKTVYYHLRGFETNPPNRCTRTVSTLRRGASPASKPRNQIDNGEAGLPDSQSDALTLEAQPDFSVGEEVAIEFSSGLPSPASSLDTSCQSILPEIPRLICLDHSQSPLLEQVELDFELSAYHAALCNTPCTPSGETKTQLRGSSPTCKPDDIFTVPFGATPDLFRDFELMGSVFGLDAQHIDVASEGSGNQESMRMGISIETPALDLEISLPENIALEELDHVWESC